MNGSNRTSLSHCSVAQLRNLLGLATETKGKVSSLPEQARHIADLKRRLIGLSAEDYEPGETLLSMVCTPETSVRSLTALKERAKLLHSRAQTEEDRGAAMILYHASIAAAFAYHGTCISSRPIHVALGLYGDLATVLRDDKLGRVFRDAERRGMTE